MEQNKNTPPFRVGQRVVAVENGCYMEDDGRIIKSFSKGEEFSVLDIWFCCKWRIDIGFRLDRKSPECYHCGQSNGLINWAPANMFRPIQHQYTDIAKEIADSYKSTEEVPDKIIIPERVNN